MSDVKGLIERLRRHDGRSLRECHEAADALERAEAVVEAARPFVSFHSGGAVWRGTAWENADELKPVLCDHRSDREVRVGHFSDLAEAVTAYDRGSDDD